MLELISLTFNNIRCFDTEQTIDFSNREKLIQIDGMHENTGGSSGAGKTTIPLALDYLLNMCSIPSTTLQSRLTKDPIYVSGKFRKDKQDIVITRSKKTGLTIETPDETISGNVKLAEEKLDEIIGMPRKVFKKTIHKEQKEGGFFLNMTAKEMYEFLIQILGLELYIAKTDIIAKDIEKSKANVTESETLIERLLINTQELEQLLMTKKEPICNITPEMLTLKKAEVLKIQEDITVIQKNKDAVIGALVCPVKNKVDGDDLNNSIQTCNDQSKGLKDQINQLVVKKQELLKEINTLDNLQNNAKKTGQEIVEINNKLNTLKNHTCPTCQQQWIGVGANQEIKALNDRVGGLTDNLLSVKARLETKPNIINQIDRIDSINSDLSLQISDIENKRTEFHVQLKNLEQSNDNEYLKATNEYNQQVRSVEAEYDNKIQPFRAILGSAQLEVATMASQISSHEANLKIHNTEKADIQNMSDSKKEQIKQTQVDLQNLNKKVLVAEEARRLIKSYVVQTFQETLDSIGNTATDILSHIPNMSNSTVYFEGCKENKSGSMRDEVNAIINVGGTNNIPIKSLSGGEKTAVDLAVDLAVIDVIEVKTGKGTDFFIMDEPFDGLDAVCKENCLEILKQVDINKKIIMVDHSSELKEMVSDIIMVIKKGESSSIV
jgi:DNA repair exonuclease SbcCD ATPase subunit